MKTQIKYDLDIAYNYGIRKTAKIQIENRGYKIVKQISDTDFIIEHENPITEPYFIIGGNNMSRLENVIEAVKASRLGENRAWIYDENGNISDEVICGDVIPFLEELKEYEIEKSDEFIEDFIKDADNFYTYNYGCAIDKDISAWYKNDNPIMIVCVHLFGDARWGFSDYFVIEMNDYYDGTPLTQFLQLDSVYQTVDINDRYCADINIFSEEYYVYDFIENETVGTDYAIDKRDLEILN